MSRYIDAEKLIDDIRPFAEYDSNRSNKDWVRRFEIAIDAQPTADVRVNVTGEWQITDAYPHNVYCSNCHKKFAQTHWAVWEDGSLPRNFCPNCGAEMRGGNDD